MPRKKKEEEEVPSESSKEDRLQKTIDAINAKYSKTASGRNILMRASNPALRRGYLQTGIIPLDVGLFGGYGITHGSHYYFYGEPGVGKSSLAYMIMARAQKEYPDKAVGIILSEGKWTPDIVCPMFDLDPERLLVNTSATMEGSLNVVKDMLYDSSSGSIRNVFSVIMVDSVAALLPAEEAERSLEEQTMGLQARVMSMALRKINSLLGDTIILWINQTRQEIGTQRGGASVPPSGKAIRFYSNATIEFRRLEKLTSGSEDPNIKDKEVIGWRVLLSTPKNTSGRGSSFQRAYYDILTGTGMDHNQSIVDYALKYGFITKGGAWYDLDGFDKPFQGADAVKFKLSEDEKLRNGLIEKIYEKAKSGK